MSGREPAIQPRLEGLLKQICHSLREDDPKTTTLDDQDFPFGYSKQLGEALCGGNKNTRRIDMTHQNPHVSHMRLQVHQMLGLYAHGTVRRPQETEEVAAIKDGLLLNYLRTSPSLRCIDIQYLLSFTVNSLNDMMMDLLLSAVQENPNVQELGLHLAKVPESLQTLLSTTESLQKLSIWFTERSDSTVEDRHFVGAGFTSNTSLKSIEMGCNLGLSVAILTALPTNAKKVENQQQHLEELTVKSLMDETAGPILRALSNYLHPKKRGLDFHLKLDGFLFAKDDIKELVQGLTGSFPVENEYHFKLVCGTSAVSKRTLCNCRLDEDAEAAWRNFLQARVETNKEKESERSLERMPRPILRELALEGNLDVAWTCYDLVECLQIPEDKDVKPRAQGEDHRNTAAAPPLHATVGSQIQSLSVSHDHLCFAGLFDVMMVKANRIRIQKLHVPDLKGDKDSVYALALCITEVSSLRDLDFHDGFLDCIGDLPDEIVASLKRNGHVQSVSSNVKSKFVHAYCKRDKFLEQLVSQPRALTAKLESIATPAAAGRQDLDSAKRTHSEMQGTGSTSTTSGDNTAEIGGGNKKHKSLLYPTLCQSFMPMPTALSRALLRFQESIGSTKP